MPKVLCLLSFKKVSDIKRVILHKYIKIVFFGGIILLGGKLRRNVVNALELPKEVMLNLPFISLTGKEELIIENYKGIIEYGDEVMRVGTASGVLRIEGKELLLKQLTSECIVVTGTIQGISFLT